MAAFAFMVVSLGCRVEAPKGQQAARDSITDRTQGPPAAGPGFALVEVADQIRLRVAGTPADRIYGAEGYAPVWVDPSGRPSAAALDAIAALLDAPSEGLDSAAYAAGLLKERAEALARGEPPPAPAIAAFDAGLSESFLRFLGHLHLGRIDPRVVGFRLDVPADQHDFARLARSSLTEGRITRLVSELRPPMALYRRLRDALARYRELAAAHPEWPPLPPAAAPVKPGQAYAGLGLLEERLRLLGDLAIAGREAAETYEEPLLAAVKRFQERHGLPADGVLGRETIAALNVPPGGRVRQIVLSLERLRWLPDLAGRFIAVNIPTFHLLAFDSLGAEGIPTLRMDVIVGRRALDTRTPVFVEEMRYVIFRPYWNVPGSIARNEILPAVRRNPAYLARNDMEIVQSPGDEALVVEESEANLALVASGRLRVRQRPGPRNALGPIKFIFPNDASVYLHGTPATELFDRAKRDFSHGCVRVEDPEGLAEWVLRGVPGWDRAAIRDAMAGRLSRRVDLASPIPVVLFYTTAIVQPDGTLGFYEDLYGHDARLMRALDA